MGKSHPSTCLHVSRCCVGLCMPIPPRPSAPSPPIPPARSRPVRTIHRVNDALNCGKLLNRILKGVRQAHLASELKSALSLVRDAAKGYGHPFQSVFAAWRGGDNTVLRLWNGGE